jgi:hypothetical protein
LIFWFWLQTLHVSSLAGGREQRELSNRSIAHKLKKDERETVRFSPLDGLVTMVRDRKYTFRESLQTFFLSCKGGKPRCLIWRKILARDGNLE